MAGGAQNDADEAITGINVTPLVDITLVLLIIFMVTAKIIVSQAIPLDLPKASPANASEVQIIFSVILAADGTTQVDGKPMPNDDALLPLAREAHAKNNELRAVIKADSAVPHGRVIHVLDLLKQAGVSKIAFGVTPVPPVIPVQQKK
jgi:biopolymer transport protein ExbD